MQKGGKIITISTFFTEENRYEQRPYRFRTPYTAAQGAKNRLTEALAWELAEMGISSVATNPGPVHSDRIYKTVYPKAAAEFLRIGGYPGLSSVEIETAGVKALQLLGETEEVVSAGIKEVAIELSKSRGNEHAAEIERLTIVIFGMLAKIQEIAEKIQANTSKMIVDGEFLTQESVAEMVMNLADERINRLVNGRVIPNDRVFYPVKPIVGTAVNGCVQTNIKDKVIVISTSSSGAKDEERLMSTLNALRLAGADHISIFINSKLQLKLNDKWVRTDSIDLLYEKSVADAFRSVSEEFGNIDSVIHFTGDYNYDEPLSGLTKKQWDSLVNNFIYIPALVTREAVNAMAPKGAVDEPSKYKGSRGTIVIIGPAAPVGKRISGATRARSDVFRGALRPYTATINQELGEVLGSQIRLYLILSGNNDGIQPENARLSNSVVSIVSGSVANRNESIFYIDEARA